ncbi:ABC transporter substrate-binding protein [Veillonella denticariosi JCM 15641]|uniref:ABC transporter substrate-binding protein n=1 Tax=Veillonella denticariosi JCM 15641 TaxID=1298594 RepID=A0A2S7Z7P8_9FIRM|nr:ABC transporter substrate-binding protein [Veillonella denticariosi]PQL19312.1 ABC transporter substrate-binding protein [Veillonella denticariosi JCM 15641]
MKRIWIAATVLLSLLMVLGGCTKTSTAPFADTRDITLDSTTYTVPAHPEKIAVLSNSLLLMLYAVDGKAISRVSTTDPLPPELEALPVLGQTANINIEQLLSLHPDFVLGLESQHKKYESVLTSNHIPTVLVNYEGIKDNVPLIKFLGNLTNHQDKADALVATYESNIQRVKDAVKNQTPARVAVLRATGKGVTAETDAAITASMVKDLGMTNVVSAHLDKATTDKTVPYSLETLAEDDPDIIFVVTMGKEEEITKAMQQAMTGNPAWNNLKAVQNNRVVYLPSKLFLLNPGLNTPEAMAKLVKEAYGIDVTF